MTGAAAISSIVRKRSTVNLTPLAGRSGVARVATLTRIPSTSLFSCATVSKLAASPRRVITSKYRSPAGG